MKYRAEIKRIALSREVPYLLHFTKVRYLPVIMQHGLLSRRELYRLGYQMCSSAEYRLDDNLDAVSLSIARLHSTFASKRERSETRDWAVLALSPEILWTLPCRFCWLNAARREIKSHRGKMDGPWAFEEMFAEYLGAREGLPKHCPSDPDAEVQVLSPIEPHLIRLIAVNRPDLVDYVSRTLAPLSKSPPTVSFEEF